MSSRSHTPKGQVARERILRAAEPLIAARGFHGTSMRDVAEACGLPLATVVYHFARKEALYGAVLGGIAEQLLGALSPGGPSGATSTLDAMLRGLVRWSLRHPGRVRLLVRELLDNPARVSHAASLPLAPVLTTLAEEVRAAGHPQAELAVLHVVGAVSYVVTARPTVRRIVGAERDREMMATYEDEAVAFARRAIGPTVGPENALGTKTRAKNARPPKEQHDGSTTADRARPARPRPRRGQDDGHGRGGRGAGRERVLR
ncbi:MAG: TetR/AcrR family transcriptional regulator [Labilithrix sp.]|nr:TetR/AcrR family transcriptional regulator [Labilithrix sp.]